MEKIRCYEEAVNNFYRDKMIPNYPICSMDIFAEYFGKLSKNLQDVSALTNLAAKEKWQEEMVFAREIMDKEHTIVVTDTQLNIVYASQNMWHMNGYMPEEVLGKKPKMFQGEKTCRETTKQISLAIKNKEPFEVVLLNYTKEGAQYNCWIKGAPVFNKKGNLVNFIAFEKEVA